MALRALVRPAAVAAAFGTGSAQKHLASRSRQKRHRRWRHRGGSAPVSFHRHWAERMTEAGRDGLMGACGRRKKLAVLVPFASCLREPSGIQVVQLENSLRRHEERVACVSHACSMRCEAISSLVGPLVIFCRTVVWRDAARTTTVQSFKMRIGRFGHVQCGPGHFWNKHNKPV